MKIGLDDAARIMVDTYEGANNADVKIKIDVAGVQAAFLKNGILVIPGTNELSDWLDFNLNLAHNAPPDTHGFTVVPGDSGAMWHAGFLEHAQIVYAFAKPLQPKMIIGHSLGAASAQIVGSSLKVPTIAFASPGTKRGKSRVAGEPWVINLCRLDDAVCHVPPKLMGFRQIGSRYWLNPRIPDPDERHSMPNYISALGEPHIRERVPGEWPT